MTEIGLSTGLVLPGKPLIKRVRWIESNYPDIKVIELCPNAEKIDNDGLSYLLALSKSGYKYTVHSPESWRIHVPLSEHISRVSLTYRLAQGIGARWVVQHPPITKSNKGGFISHFLRRHYLTEITKMAGEIPILLETGVQRWDQNQTTECEDGRNPERLAKYIDGHGRKMTSPIKGLVVDFAKISRYRSNIGENIRSLGDIFDFFQENHQRSKPIRVEEVHLVGVKTITWDPEIYNREGLRVLRHFGLNPLLMLESDGQHIDLLLKLVEEHISQSQISNLVA